MNSRLEVYFRAHALDCHVTWTILRLAQVRRHLGIVLEWPQHGSGPISLAQIRMRMPIQVSPCLGTLLRVLRMRIIVFWGLYYGPFLGSPQKKKANSHVPCQ